MTDHHAVQRRRENHRRTQLAHLLCDRSPELLGRRRVLQHERALQVSRAVQAGAQAEVSLEKRARFPEQIEEFVSCEHGTR